METDSARNEVADDIDEMIAYDKLEAACRRTARWDWLGYMIVHDAVAHHPRFEHLSFLEIVDEAIACYVSGLSGESRWSDLELDLT